MMQKIIKIIMKKKITFGIIAVLLIVGGYYGYKALKGDTTEVRYVLAAVEKGTLVASVSGSGQISVLNQVDIKPKVSGDLTWVGIKVGQEVGQGQVIASIDDSEAKKSVADAEFDLTTSKLQLEKSIAQAPIDYQKKLDSLQKTKDNLEKGYDDTFNTISNAFLNLPAVMTGLQNILYDDGLDARYGQDNLTVYKNLFGLEEDRLLVTSLANIAERDYKIARDDYDKSFLDFKALTRSSENSVIEALLQDTAVTATAISQAAKSELNLLDTIVDIAEKRSRTLNSLITTYQSNVKSYLGTANSNLSSLLSQKNSLRDLKDTITSTEQDIKIFKIGNPAGDNPIDLQISQNNIKKKEAALADLKATLFDYAVRAPFAGIIAKVNSKKGDSVSSGTTLATLITKQRMAEISLNEVDAAKVKVGQKSTLTFDAVDDLNITGQVAEIDTLGTVSQGVVTYNVKIVFDTQDERVKPGMSVSASIVTDVKTDVLMVPNSSIKLSGNAEYVEILDDAVISSQTGSGSAGIVSPAPPRQQAVQTGLANDSFTEILSGLKEGDQVISRTSTENSTVSNASTRTETRGGFGGGMMMIR
jgi:multidrug efflux pump subunit AcrA (membrane-fusion protein)